MYKFILVYNNFTKDKNETFYERLWKSWRPALIKGLCQPTSQFCVNLVLSRCRDELQFRFALWAK